MANLRKRPVTRRQVLTFLSLGAGASLLAACGGGGGPSKPAEAPKPIEAAKPAASPAGSPVASPAASSAASPAAAGQAAPAAAAPTETLRLGASVALTGPVSKEGNLVK